MYTYFAQVRYSKQILLKTCPSDMGVKNTENAETGMKSCQFMVSLRAAHPAARIAVGLPKWDQIGSECCQILQIMGLFKTVCLVITFSSQRRLKYADHLIRSYKFQMSKLTPSRLRLATDNPAALANKLPKLAVVAIAMAAGYRHLAALSQRNTDNNLEGAPYLCAG